MRVLCGIAVLTLFLLFQSSFSQADVLIEDGGINTFKAAAIPGVMQIDVASGAGQAGDYLLLTCGGFNNSSTNSFNAPAPAIFTELDTGNCGNNNNCIEGIWGGFTNNPASEMLTCSTTGTTLIFPIAALRYSNVNTINPVIGIQCSEGNSLLATAPSIMTEAGSQVVRIFTSFTFSEDETNNINVSPQTADFSIETSLEGIQIASIGSSTFFNMAGATGTADQAYMGLSPRNWRACTIALRMEPAPPTDPPPTEPPPTDPPPPTIVPPPASTSIPTLSQWGHLSIAILAVLIGVWFLRRNKVKV